MFGECGTATLALLAATGLLKDRRVAESADFVVAVEATEPVEPVGRFSASLGSSWRCWSATLMLISMMKVWVDEVSLVTLRYFLIDSILWRLFW